MNRGTPDVGFLGILRSAALIAVLAGAAGSVAFMLRAGRHNDSRFLLLLFAIWVLSPFIALVPAHVVSKRWSMLTRASLYGVMLVLSLVPLAIYGNVALGPPRAKTAAVFVVVPPASWLVIGITLISGEFSRRSNRLEG